MKTPLQKQIELLVTNGPGYMPEPAEDQEKKDSYLDLQIKLGQMELLDPDQTPQKTIKWYELRSLIEIKTHLQRCNLHYTLHTMEAIMFFQARNYHDKVKDAEERRWRHVFQHLDRIVEE